MSGRAGVAYQLTRLDLIACGHLGRGKMCVQGLFAVAVVDDDIVAVAASAAAVIGFAPVVCASGERSCDRTGVSREYVSAEYAGAGDVYPIVKRIRTIIAV